MLYPHEVHILLGERVPGGVVLRVQVVGEYLGGAAGQPGQVGDRSRVGLEGGVVGQVSDVGGTDHLVPLGQGEGVLQIRAAGQIGRASCRERGGSASVGGCWRQ